MLRNGELSPRRAAQVAAYLEKHAVEIAAMNARLDEEQKACDAILTRFNAREMSYAEAKAALLSRPSPYYVD